MTYEWPTLWTIVYIHCKNNFFIILYQLYQMMSNIFVTKRTWIWPTHMKLYCPNGNLDKYICPVDIWCLADIHISVNIYAMHASVLQEIIKRAIESANPIKKKYVAKVRQVGVRMQSFKNRASLKMQTDTQIKPSMLKVLHLFWKAIINMIEYTRNKSRWHYSLHSHIYCSVT